MVRLLTVWMILTLASLAFGQADLAIGQSRVDTLLEEWAGRGKQIQSLYTTFNRTTKDSVFQRTEEHTGSARYRHPKQARMDVLDLENNVVEAFILTGKSEIWHYELPKRQIIIYELPPDAEENGLENGPLPFLFGSRPEDAKRRYSFEILNEDEKVVHIQVRPKLDVDQQDFTIAEIWLDKKIFLPAQLMFRQPNGTVVTFQFTGMWKNVAINDDDFQPQMVKDCRVIRKTSAEQPEPSQAASPPAKGTPIVPVRRPAIKPGQ